MLTRGVNFQFKTGETVFSFEPDSSKAKVLYEAKILDCSVMRDKRSHRKPTYLIHFQGWNSSWDRVVPESFLLKNTEENRRLRLKLSTISTRYKRNSVRIRKIDHILRKHFQQRKARAIAGPASQAKQDDDDDDEDDDENDDDDGETENGSGAVSDANQEHGTSDDSDNNDDTSSSADDDAPGAQRNNDHSEKSSDDEDDDDDNADESSVHEPVCLELSSTLKHRLEQDSDLINTQKCLVKLPAVPNVISVLESYVKTFAVSMLCETVEKQKTHRLRSQQHQGPEKSIDLCKEVMDGLRVMFDFTLPLVLLYDSEKAQYHTALSQYNVKTDRSQHNKTHLVEMQETFCDSSSSDEVSFRSPPPTLPVLRRQVSPDPQVERRITRHSGGSGAAEPQPLLPMYGGKNLRERTSHTDAHNDRKLRLRTSRESSTEAAHNHSVQGGGGAKKPVGGSSPRRQEAVCYSPTRPRLDSMSSMASSSLATSSVLRDAEHDTQKAAIVKDISKWKLVPDDVCSAEGRVTVQPSFVYGAQHLLRLFVELPDLLTRMKIGSDMKKHLVRHLEMFLEYLDSHHDELFPSVGAYIKSDDVSVHGH